MKPPHHKKTSELETVVMPLPTKVVIPMLQHVGAPCEPLVKQGDRVLVGQKIGTSNAMISSPVHASVSGMVSDVRPMPYPGAIPVLAVEIKPDGLQEVHESVVPPTNLDNTGLLQRIKDSGLVGLGGAGFPTAVKLSPPPDKKVEILILNGAECEPYITSDYREMLEKTSEIIAGIKIVMELTGIKKTLIGIESNKQAAIKKLSQAAQGLDGIEVVPLRTRYPQGGEKQLIFAVTGRRVPTGGLPSDIGVLVQNVITVSFIAEFMRTGMPLIKKRVTVDGSAVQNPMNVEVLIGTSLEEVFSFCGGFKQEPKKIIMGGPMMGIAQFSLDSPVMKYTNALLALSADETMMPPEGVCIRCGKCVSACPMGLLPLYINANVTRGRIAEAMKYNFPDCIECGCCSYVCPASRHLVQSIRQAKAEMKRMKAEK